MKAKDRQIQNKSLLRNIPSIQELLNDPLIQENSIDIGYKKKILEIEVQRYREKLLSGGTDAKKDRENIHKALIFNSVSTLNRLKTHQLKRVINGTGIILHTNLGRAPLAEIAREHLQNILDHYCSLEIDLDSGKRGDRTDLVENIICLITGAEAAVVVNNNAAAILLALNSLCRNKEVPVSRGELVEIGGSFRMPEVMKAGQVKMVEVGTTNKTHLRDYHDVIGERTAGILKVHTSNYRIMGFTDSVPIEELVTLAREHKVPLIYDMGSGVLEDLEKWGFSHEPVAREYIEAGVDVVTFSADKVLGGPQAGIIIGRREYIKKIKKNHLLRALRCDKMSYAILDATLRLYLEPGHLKNTLPVARMLNDSRESLGRRGNELMKALDGFPLKTELVDTFSQMGSGALPLEKIPSLAVKILPAGMSVSRFSRLLRTGEPVIVGYLESDSFFLNLRTIRDDEVPVISQKVKKIFKK